ncbi:hypothetical protein C0995_016026 [Termitomyces sp. Mi166|nr:hypothetical protein C0995_016026 [Termitomyces sp. Mi166\
MESTATLSIPRLRLSRNAYAYERPLFRSSPDHFPEPAGTLADALPEDSDDNDRDDDQESTPKATSSAALLDTTGTPAARLRALLARSPASSTPTPMPLPQSRSSDVESDFEPLDASYGSTPSAARESLKDIFSRAMRDPGNTPQKKIKPRRNSIDTSEVDASPRVERRRIENQGKKKSLSDEEGDFAKTSEASFRSSQAATFDILRQRLINSHSQLKDLRLTDSIYQDSIPDNTHDATTFLRDSNISTTTPPVATSTPQQSLHMSIDSHFPMQSNRDSEMQRAFEGFDSSDTEGASQRPAVSFPPSAHQIQKLSSQLARASESFLSRESHTTDSSHASASGVMGQHASGDHKASGLGRERDWGWPRTPSVSPSVGPSSSGIPLRQRSFNEDSSKGSSLGSQADYQERIAELERERNLERERDWNKPRPSRPTSSLGFRLPSPSQRSRTRSLIHADSMSLAPTRSLQRHHSPTRSERASSPASFLVSGHSDEEEVVHERERNWNAPRPKWTHSSPRPVSPFKTQSPGANMRGESLTTLTTRKESPSQRSHVIDQGRIKNDSTISTQAASPAPRPTPSSHSPPHDHAHSQKPQLNGVALPRSPSPSTPKGKGKVFDHAPSELNTASHDFLHHDPTSVSTTKSGTSHSFSFVKKRTPLEPIEMETDNFGQKTVSQRRDLLSSPTRSSKASAKPDGIPIRSPQNSKLPAKGSIRASSPVSNIKFESLQSESLVPDARDTDSEPLVLDVSSTVHRDPEDESSNAEDLSQETLEYTPESSSPLQLSNGRLEQSGSSLQQLNSNHTTLLSGPATQKPQIPQEFLPLPSPPSQSSLRDSHVKSVSPLLTPPRRPSTSQIEFQTPSPPKNMPDLPGPPTSSEDETDQESTRAPFGDLRFDLTAMKTPRPPGAWTSTLAFQHKIPRPPLLGSNVKHEELSSRLQTSDLDSKANTTTTKTPRPPGSWVSTPVPLLSEKLPPEDLSHSGNAEEHEDGLSTPAASFSKRSSEYAQTPAPPGAYIATPAGRKSIMKVRFDGINNTGTRDSVTRDALEDITNSLSSNATPRATPSQLEISSQARTLGLSTPNSPVSRRTRSQTSPGIRILDAFGRELVKHEAGKAANNSKNKNGIRIVDALGREVEDNDQSSHLTTEEVVPELSAPLKHGEALLRVRQGLSDLVNDLSEMDELEQNGQELDYTRLETLQQTSAEARVARARVSAAISSNAEDIKNKLKTLRASVKESKFSSLADLLDDLSLSGYTTVTGHRYVSTPAHYNDGNEFMDRLPPPPQPTLFTTIQKFQKHNSLPSKSSHPFAAFAEQSCSQLQDLINTADQLAHSLSVYSSTAFSNPKLFSLLRQHLKVDDSLHQSDRRIHHILDALRTRPRARYGEDIPLNPVAAVGWCINRLESWGTTAGMETFKDDGRQGGISVVLGGKVVVVDVDFSVNKSKLNTPKIMVSSVKTSYAITGSDGTTSNSEGSSSLDEFLRRCIQNFCDEVQKPEDLRNFEEAARLGVVVTQQLQYLTMLDKLAARKDDGGLQWFTGLDKLCPTLEVFATSEAEAVASSLSLAKAPLDIFLLRSHALPLPFLLSPSVSFLVNLSSQAYLALLKRTEASTSPWDVPVSSLRTHMFSIQKGLSLATLTLTVVHTGKIFPATMNMPTFTARPTFPLAPQGSDLEHSFPQTMDQSSAMMIDLEAGKQYMWVLDFTNGGRNAGIVMSQSRMREIELIVNPLGGIDTMDPVTLMAFGTGSWVDLLLNPDAQVSPERYTALYISPSSVHPPLQLRLTAPEEAGFRLEKVPVHNMKEVWGILEVVREQCWLNEILSGCQWSAEGLRSSIDKLPNEKEATEEELQAILDGNLPPRKIPVNVFLPSQNIATDALFQTPDIDGISIPHLPPRRPRIVMTSPERPPISGLVEIAVIYDESRPRGIVVEVNGAMGSDIQSDVLEEICRRGGTLGLAGRVWSKAL